MIEVYISDDFPSNSIKIYIKELTFPLERRIGNQFLSELTSALINMGYRDQSNTSANEIRRIENHLNDMRAIVFDGKSGTK